MCRSPGQPPESSHRSASTCNHLLITTSLQLIPSLVLVKQASTQRRSCVGVRGSHLRAATTPRAFAIARS